MVDTEEKETIFGLLATAQEHQNLIEDATKALEIEKQALKRAVAALETIVLTLPSAMEIVARQSLSEASASIKKEGDSLHRVAQDTKKKMDTLTGTFYWKCALAGALGGVAFWGVETFIGLLAHLF